MTINSNNHCPLFKTSCFGMKSMALYGERKAYYDTKTTCFGTVMLDGTF